MTTSTTRMCSSPSLISSSSTSSSRFVSSLFVAPSLHHPITTLLCLLFQLNGDEEEEDDENNYQHVNGTAAIIGDAVPVTHNPATYHNYPSTRTTTTPTTTTSTTASATDIDSISRRYSSTMYTANYHHQRQRQQQLQQQGQQNMNPSYSNNLQTDTENTHTNRMPLTAPNTASLQIQSPPGSLYSSVPIHSAAPGSPLHINPHLLDPLHSATNPLSIETLLRHSGQHPISHNNLGSFVHSSSPHTTSSPLPLAPGHHHDHLPTVLLPPGILADLTHPLN